MDGENLTFKIFAENVICNYRSRPELIYHANISVYLQLSQCAWYFNFSFLSTKYILGLCVLAFLPIQTVKPNRIWAVSKFL